MNPQQRRDLGARALVLVLVGLAASLSGGCVKEQVVVYAPPPPDGGVAGQFLVPSSPRETTYMLPFGPPTTPDEAYRALDWRCAAAELERDEYVDRDAWFRLAVMFASLFLAAATTALTGLGNFDGGDTAAHKRFRQAAIITAALATVAASVLSSYRFEGRIDGNRRALARIQASRHIAAALWPFSNQDQKQRLLAGLAEVCLGTAYLEQDLGPVQAAAWVPPQSNATDGGTPATRDAGTDAGTAK